jgi:hypothetical protein
LYDEAIFIMKDNTITMYVLLTIAVILLIVASYLIGGEFHTARMIRQHRVQPIPTTVDYVRTWMTFSYVDTAFQLPPTYLQNALKVTDAHYPRLTISRAAEEQGTNATDYLNQVKTAINNYRTNPQVQ